MDPRGGRALCCLWATLLLAPPRAGALKVEDTLVELDFFQESFPSEKKSGEFLLEFDNEEILHVDWEKKQNVWRLPDFQRFTSFEVQGALANIAVMKNNMEVLMKRSNRTRALNVSKAPSPIPETMENVLCALGLAFGILGIIAGTILFFKAMRMNGRRGLI
nr:mamu class II histocompatibility antigen, DR alpha chain-like isoform X1 [Zootoca vivipara]